MGLEYETWRKSYIIVFTNLKFKYLLHKYYGTNKFQQITFDITVLLTAVDSEGMPSS